MTTSALPTTTAAIARLHEELDRRYAAEQDRRRKQLADEDARCRIQEGIAEAFLDEYFSGWLAEALAPMRIEATAKSWRIAFDFNGYTWRIDDVEQRELATPSTTTLMTTCRLIAPAPGRTLTLDAKNLETTILASLAEHEINLHPDLVAIP